MVAGLLLLAAVPVIAGAVRFTELVTDPEVTAANARFVAARGPVLLHITAATVYALLGALQFAPALRRTQWHRSAGRVLVPCGLLVAGTGLWMTATYELPAVDGPVHPSATAAAAGAADRAHPHGGDGRRLGGQHRRR